MCRSAVSFARASLLRPPCFHALCEDRALPSAVLGPIEVSYGRQFRISVAVRVRELDSVEDMHPKRAEEARHKKDRQITALFINPAKHRYNHGIQMHASPPRINNPTPSVRR
jgi:hypothetical protein